MYSDCTRMGDYIWKVHLYLMRKYGCDAAAREISPLVWYANTGRASLGFEQSLMKAKPFMIGRILHKGGSYDEAIDRIAEYIGRPTRHSAH